MFEYLQYYRFNNNLIVKYNLQKISVININIIFQQVLLNNTQYHLFDSALIHIIHLSPEKLWYDCIERLMNEIFQYLWEKVKIKSTLHQIHYSEPDAGEIVIFKQKFHNAVMPQISIAPTILQHPGQWVRSFLWCQSTF